MRRIACSRSAVIVRWVEKYVTWSGVSVESATVLVSGRNSFTSSFAVAFGSTFHDGERAGIKRQAAAVGDPKSAEGALGHGIPERDFFGVDTRVDDRHQRRLVFADGDPLLQVVLEQVADLAARSFGFEVLGC